MERRDPVYSRILVPLDSSERAEAILPHVEALGGVQAATIFLLHVIEPTALAPSAPGGSGVAVSWMRETYEDLMDQMRDLALEYLSSVQSRLAGKGISCEMLVEIGPVVERIIASAADREVDLIALASHGRTGLSTVFFGSVAAGVLHRSERPLLLVRSRDHEG
jgi:nucleotide-binding universal stress UspA family protein